MCCLIFTSHHQQADVQAAAQAPCAPSCGGGCGAGGSIHCLPLYRLVGRSRSWGRVAVQEVRHNLCVASVASLNHAHSTFTHARCTPLLSLFLAHTHHSSLPRPLPTHSPYPQCNTPTPHHHPPPLTTLHTTPTQHNITTRVLCPRLWCYSCCGVRAVRHCVVLLQPEQQGSEVWVTLQVPGCAELHTQRNGVLLRGQQHRQLLPKAGGNTRTLTPFLGVVCSVCVCRAIVFACVYEGGNKGVGVEMLLWPGVCVCRRAGVSLFVRGQAVAVLMHSAAPTHCFQHCTLLIHSFPPPPAFPSIIFFFLFETPPQNKTPPPPQPQSVRGVVCWWLNSRDTAADHTRPAHHPRVYVCAEGGTHLSRVAAAQSVGTTHDMAGGRVRKV